MQMCGELFFNYLIMYSFNNARFIELKTEEKKKCKFRFFPLLQRTLTMFVYTDCSTIDIQNGAVQSIQLRWTGQ